jgi:hypothetical protein
MYIILVILLVLILVGALPTWYGPGPYATTYGYWPSGTIGLVVIILIVLLLMRVI